MSCRLCLRPHALLAAVVLLLSYAPAARAAPDLDEPWMPGVAPRMDLRDLPPHDLWDPPASGAPIWVAIEGQLADHDGTARELGVMLLVGIPLDRLARPRLGGAIAQEAPPVLKPPRPRPRVPPPEPAPPPPPAPEAPPPPPEPPLPIPVAITPSTASGAVAAALRAARLTDPDARLDALASRARSSALLPELRIRATRLVDDAQNLSPTEYDPARTTASGGTSVWLEARATWRLDRLVFADDEVPIERMRQERADARTRVVTRVLELLFAWQRALALEADPGQSPEDHLAASLKVIECAATLDVLTDGWFSAWRRSARDRRR